MNKCISENINAVKIIKDGIARYVDGNEQDCSLMSEAAEAWFEISEEKQGIILVAPKNGGIFTTKERAIIKTREFRVAHFGEGGQDAF